MDIIIMIVLIAALLLTIILPIAGFFRSSRTKRSFKRSFAANASLFFGTLIISQIVMFTTASAATEGTSGAGLATGLGYIAAGLVTGLSCLGAGIAVASAASAAIGAISEEGSLFGKALIFVGLAEGVALYGLIISFMILNKL
jgi:V/A-type H+-transporting ATPase subunit K